MNFRAYTFMNPRSKDQIRVFRIFMKMSSRDLTTVLNTDLDPAYTFVGVPKKKKAKNMTERMCGGFLTLETKNFIKRFKPRST